MVTCTTLCNFYRVTATVDIIECVLTTIIVIICLITRRGVTVSSDVPVCVIITSLVAINTTRFVFALPYFGIVVVTIDIDSHNVIIL